MQNNHILSRNHGWSENPCTTAHLTTQLWQLSQRQGSTYDLHAQFPRLLRRLILIATRKYVNACDIAKYYTTNVLTTDARWPPRCINLSEPFTHHWTGTTHQNLKGSNFAFPKTKSSALWSTMKGLTIQKALRVRTCVLGVSVWESQLSP